MCIHVLVAYIYTDDPTLLHCKARKVIVRWYLWTRWYSKYIYQLVD